MLFKEIIAVYTENRTKSINKTCRVIDCESRWYMYLPLGFKGLTFLKWSIPFHSCSRFCRILMYWLPSVHSRYKTDKISVVHLSLIYDLARFISPMFREIVLHINGFNWSPYNRKPHNDVSWVIFQIQTRLVSGRRDSFVSCLLLYWGCASR
jgi:hypothetical protein